MLLFKKANIIKESKRFVVTGVKWFGMGMVQCIG